MSGAVGGAACWAMAAVLSSAKTASRRRFIGSSLDGFSSVYIAKRAGGNRAQRNRARIGDGCTGQKVKADQGRDRRLGSRDRLGGACPGHLAGQIVLRRLDRVRRRAQFACLAGRRRDAGHAAGDQRGMRAPGGAHRAWAQGQDQSEIGVRPQKLFLSGPAAGLPDQPVQIADRRRGRGRGRHARRRDRARRHRAAASGAGRRQVAARPEPVDVAVSTSTAPAWR